MLALLGAGPAWAGPIITQVTPPMHCPAGKVFVRADFKTCPTENRRRARTVRRACCQGESGKVHCMRYPRCPGRSPA
jgi:hypothetical protein